MRLYAGLFGPPSIAPAGTVESLLDRAAGKVTGQRFTPQFLRGEWSDVVDAWQLKTWEGYRDVARLGRKTRIGGKQRELLWSIFADVRAELDRLQMMTWSDVFGRLTDHLAAGADRPFAYAVVDEAQDLAVPECRFLAVLASAHPDALFFAGDLGQRIFQQPSRGNLSGSICAAGRTPYGSTIARRTKFAAKRIACYRLSFADVDGNVESRKGTVSVFNGPAPTVTVFEDEKREKTGGRKMDRRAARGGDTAPGNRRVCSLATSNSIAPRPP